MAEGGLNTLLKWGVQHSSDATTEGETEAPKNPARGINSEALAQLFGAPSDADRMREAMAAIQHPEVDLHNKIIAFDNFEQLIENLDNANNMEPLKLWVPLVEQLANPEPELRRYAAWCVGTAVQNNTKSQERCLIVGAIPHLVKMALTETIPANRKKAAFAISSEVRNFQAGLDTLLEELPESFEAPKQLDASDMDAVDIVIDKLRNP